MSITGIKTKTKKTAPTPPWIRQPVKMLSFIFANQKHIGTALSIARDSVEDNSSKHELRLMTPKGPDKLFQIY